MYWGNFYSFLALKRDAEQTNQPKPNREVKSDKQKEPGSKKAHINITQAISSISFGIESK